MVPIYEIWAKIWSYHGSQLWTDKLIWDKFLESNFSLEASKKIEVTKICYCRVTNNQISPVLDDNQRLIQKPVEHLIWSVFQK